MASSSSSKARNSRKQAASKLYGIEEPRVWTKPLRELTEETTLGFDVIQFAEDVLEITLLPWQKWLFIHALEIVGDFESDWYFRFRVVLVLVGRQNGKTTLGAILALFFLYVLYAGLVVGSAQDLEQAEDTWAMCVEMAENDPELADQIQHIWRTNGSKRLQLTQGRDYRVRATNRKSRGKTADLVLLDELREHQSWQAYSALSKTIISKKSALLWCMSNAGDATSVVLRHFRNKAHEALGDPDGIITDAERIADEDELEIEDDTLAIFEWSASPDAKKTDRQAWAQSNPSLGYTITERAIAADASNDPDEVFRTECLCQWVTLSVESPFPENAWEAGIDDASEIAIDAEVFYGVDISADRTAASIAACGLRPDGDYHVELVAYRSGIAWLVGWLQGVASETPMQLALQSRGSPVASMAEIFDAIDGVEVVACKGPDVAGWCGRFYDGVMANRRTDTSSKKIYHRTQPRLDLAANIAVTRPLGDGAWAWDRNKSLEDISPLVACTVAFGAATSVEPPKLASAYEAEGHSLMFA